MTPRDLLAFTPRGASTSACQLFSWGFWGQVSRPHACKASALPPKFSIQLPCLCVHVPDVRYFPLQSIVIDREYMLHFSLFSVRKMSTSFLEDKCAFFSMCLQLRYVSGLQWLNGSWTSWVTEWVPGQSVWSHSSTSCIVERRDTIPTCTRLWVRSQHCDNSGEALCLYWQFFSSWFTRSSHQVIAVSEQPGSCWALPLGTIVFPALFWPLILRKGIKLVSQAALRHH